MSRPTRPSILVPRGLCRATAAAYIGVGPAKFDQMVGDGRMPLPKRIDGRIVWDRHALDEAFEALPDSGQHGPANDEARNPWHGIV